jgi:hypothetical protein
MSINPQTPGHQEGSRLRVREKAVLRVHGAVRAQTRSRVLAVVLAVILSTHGGSVFATPATGARTAGPGVASAVRAGAGGAGGFGRPGSRRGR